MKTHAQILIYKHKFALLFLTMISLDALAADVVTVSCSKTQDGQAITDAEGNLDNVYEYLWKDEKCYFNNTIIGLDHDWSFTPVFEAKYDVAAIPADQKCDEVAKTEEIEIENTLKANREKLKKYGFTVADEKKQAEANLIAKLAETGLTEEKKAEYIAEYVEQLEKFKHQDETAGPTKEEMQQIVTALKVAKATKTPIFIPQGSKFRIPLSSVDFPNENDTMLVEVFRLPNGVTKNQLTEFSKQPFRVCHTTEAGQRAHYKRVGGMSVGALVTPFKLRKGGDFGTDVTAAPYLSYAYETVEWLAFVGPSRVTVPVDGKSTKEETALSAGFGTLWRISNDWDLTFLVGTDHLTGDAGDNWKYQDEVWMAFGLGYKIGGGTPMK